MNKKTIADKLINVICALSIIFWLWLIISYIDIISHNLTTCEYQSWNLLILMFKK